MLAVLIAMLTVPQALAFDVYDYTQTVFDYCFDPSVSPDQQAAIRMGIQTWGRLGSLVAGEVSCSQSSALTVRMAPIDNELGTLAKTHLNEFGHPDRITFDVAESWYTGSGVPNCDQVDMWGVASHEFGHVWGSDHAQLANSPQHELNTMRTTMVTESCPSPDTSYLSRSLTSDDEAAGQFVQLHQWLPNPGFERGTDCIDPGACVSAFYWATTGNWTRACGTQNAYEGSCYLRVSEPATLYSRIQNTSNAPPTVWLTFYARNSSSTAQVPIDIAIWDMTTGITVLSTRCIVDLDQTGWQPCGPLPFQASGDHRYEVDINPYTVEAIGLDGFTLYTSPV